MFDLDPLRVKDTCDQEEAVAVSGVLLGTHHRNPILKCPVEQPSQSGLEQGSLGHSAVERMAVRVVELLAVWATTELFAQEQILDSRFSKSELEIAAIELWVEARER